MIKNIPHKGRLILFFTTLSLGLLALISIPRVSMPLLVAFILSRILRPLIPIFNKLGIGINLSLVFIFFGIGIFLLYPIIKFAPAIQGEIEKFQYYIPKIEQFVEVQYGTFQSALKRRLGIELPLSLTTSSISYDNDVLKSFLLKLPNVLASLLEWFLLLPLFLFFLLRDGPSIKRKFFKFVPNILFEKGYYLVSQFSKQVGGYIAAKSIEAAIIGIIITFGLLLMDVRFAFILGVIAAITNIVPYLGPILGLIPAAIIGLIDYGMGPSFGAIIALYVVANIIDLAFVFPILVSRIVNLHPALVLVSVIIGSQYMGIAGMIVSIPLTASLKLVFEEIYRGFDLQS
ncbi:MAG: AI-2E family transporter [Bacteriovoracales bacterium]|nr:AI-2E family transporter [Bacteriovoracales bacterium]